MEEDKYQIEDVNMVGLLSVVWHFLVHWSLSRSAHQRFWSTGGDESYGGVCIGLCSRQRHELGNCLPFLSLSFVGVEGPCSLQCFDDLICGFCQFSLIIVVLIPSSLGIYVVCLVFDFVFYLQDLFLTFVCVTFVLWISCHRLIPYFHQLQKICQRAIYMLDILCTFSSVSHLWSSVHCYPCVS